MNNSTLTQRILRNLALLLVLLSAAAPAFGFDTVTVAGRGTNESNAIKDALAEAVIQVNGTKVEADTEVSRVIHDCLLGITQNFTTNSTDADHVRTVSGGFVLNYEVLESNTPEIPRVVKVKVNVLKFDPKNPRPGSAKTMVAGRFDFAMGALKMDGKSAGAAALLDTLRSDLETALVKSRKFIVLTRNDLGPLMNELEFIAGKWVGEKEKGKLRNQYGADYLVSGRVQLLSVHTGEHTVKLTGHVNRTKTAQIIMTMSLYNVASGQIEWSEEYERSYSWDDAALDQNPEFRDDGTVANSMVLDAAASLSRMLLVRTFRPKVVKIKSGLPGGPVFVLNTNSSVHPMGQVFELVHVGEDLIDPDTGLSLGPDETFVGLIHIHRQDHLKSEAVFVEPSEELRAWASEKELKPSSLACRVNE
ncbi:MAG: curli biogenesis system outer membrane secretion channel CsgG [Planctomycetota bacterium]|jgi:curli biogenesis system outer membrane secretion channel CsgG